MTLKSPEDFHQKLGFAFHATLALPLAAFVYLFLEVKHRNLEPALSNDRYISTLIIVLPIIAALAAGWGYYRFKESKKEENGAQKLQQKLIRYYNISLKFYAFIGIAATVLVLGLYYTTSYIFIFGYVLLLFLMSLNRPTVRKYVRDLHLSKEEQEILLKKRSFTGEDTTSQEEN